MYTNEVRIYYIYSLMFTTKTCETPECLLCSVHISLRKIIRQLQIGKKTILNSYILLYITKKGGKDHPTMEQGCVYVCMTIYIYICIIYTYAYEISRQTPPIIRCMYIAQLCVRTHLLKFTCHIEVCVFFPVWDLQSSLSLLSSLPELPSFQLRISFHHYYSSPEEQQC